MKNFTFIPLILFTASFFGLQAMSPDSERYYGPLKPRGKKALSVSINSVGTDQEKRIFLFDEEHAVLLKKQLDDEHKRALEKQIEKEILEDYKKLNDSVHHNNNSDDELEEIINFVAHYKALKENKTSIKVADKKNVHFLLPDNQSSVKTLLRENKKNCQCKFIIDDAKNRPESPLAQWHAEGKESPFSEPITPPSLSPTHAEEECSDTETTPQEDSMFFME